MVLISPFLGNLQHEHDPGLAEELVVQRPLLPVLLLPVQTLPGRAHADVGQKAHRPEGIKWVKINADVYRSCSFSAELGTCDYFLFFSIIKNVFKNFAFLILSFSATHLSSSSSGSLGEVIFMRLPGRLVTRRKRTMSSLQDRLTNRRRDWEIWAKCDFSCY